MPEEQPSHPEPTARSFVPRVAGASPGVTPIAARPPRLRAVPAGEFVRHRRPPLTVRSMRHGTTHVVAVSGELDLATAHAVEDELKVVEATDAAAITLDLSGLDFIDSTGLHVIISAYSRSQANGNRLTLLRGPRQVQRIFEMTGMTGLLPFVA